MNITTNTKKYSKTDIVSLLKLKDKDVFKGLSGNPKKKAAIVEFSNYCSHNCLYCELRRSNEKLERFRLETEKIIQNVLKVEKQGFKSVVLQSGVDCNYTIDTLISLLGEIKANSKIEIILSISERPEIDYKKLRDAGAESFLLKHKTSDPVLYRTLHPDLKYSERLKCLRTLKSLGFKTGSGIYVGFPGQTIESIANDILMFKEFELDMVCIDPYVPHPDTPLARKFKEAGGYFVPALGHYDIEDLIYKIVAVTGLVAKDACILDTTPFLD